MLTPRPIKPGAEPHDDGSGVPTPLTARVICSYCKGTGGPSDGPACPSCDGAGTVPSLAWAQLRRIESAS